MRPTPSLNDRSRARPLFAVAAGLLSLCGVGCVRVNSSPSFSLKPPEMVKNGVVLDVMFINYPAGEPTMNETLWQEIDELHFPADLRRRLAANGLRAGIIGGPLPLELESRLRLQEKPEAESSLGFDFESLEATKGASRRQLRLQAGRRANIITLGEKQRPAQMSLLLVGDDGQVKGRTYRDVMGLFAARAYPQGDGGVRLELTPEIEHGAPQKRFVPGDGMFRVEFGPPHEVFDEHKLAAALAPGQFLAVTADLNKPGSLGHRLLIDSEGETEMQKLLLVRLAHCEYDDRFDAAAGNDVAENVSGNSTPLQTIDMRVETHENTPRSLERSRLEAANRPAR